MESKQDTKLETDRECNHEEASYKIPHFEGVFDEGHDMAFHLIDKDEDEMCCRIIPFYQTIASVGSPVFKIALLPENKSKRKRRRQESGAEPLEEKKEKAKDKDRGSPLKVHFNNEDNCWPCGKNHSDVAFSLVLHLETHANRSLDTLLTFLKCFLPLQTLCLPSLISLRNVAEWLELGFEFEVKGVIDASLTFINTFSKKLRTRQVETQIGTEVATNLCKIPRILNLLERFGQTAILDVLIQGITSVLLWDDVQSSSQASSFLTNSILTKALSHLEASIKQEDAFTRPCGSTCNRGIWETTDPEGRLCLVKILKHNQNIMFVHYVGWSSKWDYWIPTTRLHKPRNDPNFYTTSGPETRPEVVKALEEHFSKG